MPPVAPTSETERDVKAWVGRWGKKWRIPRLENTVQVRFSTRLKRSWGRADTARCRISISAELLRNRTLLKEVLRHEAAHIAAYALIGRKEPPHGPTWRSLVAAAGGTPSRHLLADAPVRFRGNASRYMHRCPVCHFSRLARRPMKNWRCAECVLIGLDGGLVVTRLPTR